MRHFELLKYMKDLDHGRSFEQNRILENQFSPIDQSQTTKENEDNTDHGHGKYSKLLHKGRLIHPNRVLWAVASVAMLTFSFYFYLKYGFGSADLILAILPVACFVLFVWCASFLIPFCHCIYLDPHGLYITRYFMTKYYSWWDVHDIGIGFRRFGRFVHFNFNKDRGIIDQILGYDLKIDGFYEVDKKTLADLMLSYRYQCEKHKLDRYNPNPRVYFSRKQPSKWGRDSEKAGAKLSRTSIWEKLRAHFFNY